MYDLLRGRIYPTELTFGMHDGESLGIHFESLLMRNLFLLSLEKTNRLRFNNKYFELNRLRAIELKMNTKYNNIILNKIKGEIYVTYTSIELDSFCDGDLAYFQYAKECKWMSVDRTPDRLNIKIFKINSFLNGKDEINMITSSCYLV